MRVGRTSSFGFLAGIVRRNVQSLSMIVILGVLLANSLPAFADAFNFVAFVYPGTTITLANGITNSGDIFGNAGEPVDGGFLLHNGSFSPFEGIVSVSNNGMILYNSPSGPTVLFNGINTHVNAPSPVVAINNSGTVLLTDGFLTGSTFHPVSFPGSVSTTLKGINDLGQIVGAYTTFQSTPHGFLYDNGVYTSIDFPGSISSMANAINNEGEIVGDYTVSFPPHMGTQGFIYKNGSYQTFDAYNYFADEAATIPTGINDFGQIVGSQPEGLYSGPPSFLATPVPEPGTLGLVGTGLLVLTGGVRRKWFR